MKPTAALLRQAADGIDSWAAIEVTGHHGDLAIKTDDARNLVAFGMSLAYVIATTAAYSTYDTGTDAIDDAISSVGRPQILHLGMGHLIAYWPGVPAADGSN